MATVLLMLGSVISAAVAGNKTVKREEEVDKVPEEKVSNSTFWSNEVERVKTDPVTTPEECEWSEWSKCTQECDGGTQFRTDCNDKTETRPCNTQACPPKPVVQNGYLEHGKNKSCDGTPIYSSSRWELVNPGEDKMLAPSFDDPYYRKYQRRAAVNCNRNPECSYISVSKDGQYKMFSKSLCENLKDETDVTTWQKQDSTVAQKDVTNDTYTPHEIDGYTSLSKVQEPPWDFPWRQAGKSDEGLICVGEKTELGVDTKVQGSEVNFKSDEYEEYVKKVQAQCELEHDCNYISVKKNGYGIMFKDCPKFKDSSKHESKPWKTFKRGEDKPKRPEPPSKLENHDAEFMGYKPVSKYYRCNNHNSALRNEFLRKEGEAKLDFTDFFSHKYQNLLKRGIELCNKDPRCQYLEISNENATARTFKKSDCLAPHAVHFNMSHKIWEKKDWKDPNVQDPVHGYEQYGSINNSCGTANPQSGWISQGYVEGSKSLGSKGEAESFKKADGTMDDTYSEYLKQGAMLCNSDPNCKYVTVWLSGAYRTFDADACEKQPLLGYSKAKTWKQNDKSVVGSVPAPPPPPPPPEKHGYINTHIEKMCPEDKQKWIKYSGSTVGFESTEYDDNLKSGIMKCNDDPKCKYVTLFRDGLTGLVNEGECDSPSRVQNAKIWEKKDPNVIGFSPPPKPPEPPKPPPFNCGGNPNTQIPMSSVNDDECDCQPGFDDEPETGKCDAPKKASLINSQDNNWENWRGVLRQLYGKPMVIRPEKSGWEHTDHNLGKYKANQNGQWVEDCKKKSEKEAFSPGFSVWRKGGGTGGWLGDTWYCRVYKKNNGKGTDDNCTKTPWKDDACMYKPSGVFEPDVDDKNNQWTMETGLYWRYFPPTRGFNF